MWKIKLATEDHKFLNFQLKIEYYYKDNHEKCRILGLRTSNCKQASQMLPFSLCDVEKEILKVECEYYTDKKTSTSIYTIRV